MTWPNGLNLNAPTAGAICLAVAVLLFLTSRPPRRLPRVFLTILLLEAGAALLLLGSWTTSAPAEAERPPSTEGPGYLPAPAPEDPDNGHRGPIRGGGSVGPILSVRAGPSIGPPPRPGESSLGVVGRVGDGTPGPSRGSGGAGGAGGLAQPAGVGGGGNFFPSEKDLDYDKAVFVLDASGSMAGQRYERLCQDLEERLRAFDDGTRFAVLFFNDTAVHLKGESDLKWRVKSKEVVDEVVAAMKEVKPDKGTWPFDALVKALELKPKSVVCLTDGGFNDKSAGEKTKAAAVKEVVELARKNKARVYGIFVSEPDAHDRDQGQRDMKSILTNPSNYYEAKP